MIRHSLLLFIPLLASSLASAQVPNRPCEINIRIDRAGRLHEYSLLVTRKTLINNLRNGCKSGPVSSISISAAPNIQYRKLVDIMDVVKQNAPENVQVAIVTPHAQ